MRPSRTRLLLACAAIGVAGGLPFAVTGYLHALVAAAAPVLYGLIIGIYFLPGVVAQTVLRRAGVALATGAIAGLTAAAFNPANALRHIGTGALIGLLQELPFALGRYRSWRGWISYAGALFAGLVFGGAVALALGLEHLAPVAEAVYLAVWVLAPVAITWLGRRIGAGVDATGAARGLAGGAAGPRAGSGGRMMVAAA